MTPRDDIPRVSPGAKIAVWVALGLLSAGCLFGLGWLMMRLVLP